MSQINNQFNSDNNQLLGENLLLTRGLVLESDNSSNKNDNTNEEIKQDSIFGKNLFSETINKTILSAQESLASFASSKSFDADIVKAFGNNYNRNVLFSFRSQWQQSNFRFPENKSLSQETLAQMKKINTTNFESQSTENGLDKLSGDRG